MKALKPWEVLLLVLCWMGLLPALLAPIPASARAFLAVLAILCSSPLSSHRLRGVRVAAGACMVLGALAVLFTVVEGRRLQNPSYPGGGLTGLASSGRATWVGENAPDIVLPVLDQQPVNLSDLKGKRTILVFWATWCMPCLMEIPHLNHLAETYPDKVAIHGLCLDSESELRDLASRQDFKYPVGIVGQQALFAMPAPYSRVQGLPTLMVISPEGTFEHIETGALPADLLESMALGRSG